MVKTVSVLWIRDLTVFFAMSYIEDVKRGAELRVRSMDSKTAGYPRFRLFTPNPPDFFLMGCSLTKKKQAVPPASMLAD